ncbi:MAG TPA: hypothetical protein VL242_39390 [Sorangium sp.]|nr:hypothetical protein [Sorangium sp.]
MGHIEAALGGEMGGNHGNCCRFRRLRGIDRYSWRGSSAGVNRRNPSDAREFGQGVTTDRTPSDGMGPVLALGAVKWKHARQGTEFTVARRRAVFTPVLAIRR